MIIKFNKETCNNDYLADKYSKYADNNLKIDGVPYVNFSFTVEDLDLEDKYLSWVLLDHDSNPVIQFSWIHWLVANYQVSSQFETIPELLVESCKQYIGGKNSFYSPLASVTNEKVCLNYGGPTPPDKDHVYTLVVYAHEEKLHLRDGFYYNQFLNGLDGISTKVATAKILGRK